MYVYAWEGCCTCMHIHVCGRKHSSYEAERERERESEGIG